MADLTTVTRKAIDVAGKANPASGEGPFSSPKGLAAAGVALVALPLAAEKLAKLSAPKISRKVSEVGEKAKDKTKEQVKDAAGDLTPDMPKGLFGGGGMLSGILGGDGSDDTDEGGAGKGSAAPGFGSGRRMPIQQAADVAVPVRQAYDAWTRFEDWPEFMHRLESVEQIDDTTVAFQAKIWGIKKRFEAEILEQRPNERIEWDVSQGYAHTGVVTFHELSDRLTRVEITLDVEPDSLLEKASRGMRFVKRAVRGELHRFKAYVELEQEVDNGWRGTIEDGSVKRRSPQRRGSGGNRRSASSNGRSAGSSGGRKKASSS
jgi:uncharacterized membrane protein